MATAEQPEIDWEALQSWLSLFELDREITFPVDAYYDAERRHYLAQNSGARWLSLTEQQFKRFLASRGYSTQPKDGDGILSPADAVLLFLQDKRDIRYAGPLAGHRAGFYQQNGARILVTESPRLTHAQSGRWHTLQSVFEGLFLSSELDYGPAQLDVFYGWLKMAVLNGVENY